MGRDGVERFGNGMEIEKSIVFSGNYKDAGL